MNHFGRRRIAGATKALGSVGFRIDADSCDAARVPAISNPTGNHCSLGDSVLGDRARSDYALQRIGVEDIVTPRISPEGRARPGARRPNGL